MITPHVKESKKIKKGFFIGVFFGGIILLLFTSLSLLILGVEQTINRTFPTYALAKRIDIGRFLNRLEALLAFMWFITIYFKLVICFFISAVSLSHTMGIKNYKVLTFPLAIMLISLPLIVFPSFVALITFPFWPIAVTFGFLIPILLLLLAKLKNRSS
jgi:spore germination protein KB